MFVFSAINLSANLSILSSILSADIALIVSAAPSTDLYPVFDKEAQLNVEPKHACVHKVYSI